ncbi:MAG TPA: family 1 glycosylhydrolase [Candidatus Kapabacteria bacterium]|nr:family 1 glycosylhydrolase [Candidatus Kapabacteria bacterium]
MESNSTFFNPNARGFLFATGIENSYPTITLPDGKRFRVDEMEKCGHYDRWQEDFERVKELGVAALRYGLPYYKTHIAPGKYDWDFADETFAALKQMGVLPIADLCHFGVPDWIGDFQNPDWPRYFAEYAKAFAKRFDWVQFYTPVNEMFVAANLSGLRGWWNEQLHSDEAFVRALHNLCKADVLAMKAILEVRPDAVFVQSESSEYYHPSEPSSIDLANVLNEKRFLSLDLIYGYPINAMMYEYLLDHGMTRDEYHWFAEHQVRARCIMGNDYYITNEHLVHPDGLTTPAGEIFGYYVITHQYYQRYRLPVMHTETNIREPNAVDWLWKEWANVHRLREDGVPIVGFTWYSLTDQVDWDSMLTKNDGHVDDLGLYDLNRKIRPVGEAYKKLISQWQDLLPIEMLHPKHLYY